MAVQAHATAKYVRTSAQKAGLVMDLIRGRDVNHALATLKFARKGVARDIEKVLRSAIANATQKDGFGGDVERLYVNACYANQGPSQKRIRPAPMGRAFRVVKRTAHLTVQVSEKPSKIVETAEPVEGAPKRPRGAAPKRATKKTATKLKAKSGATKPKATTKPKAKSGARKTTAKSRKTATEK
jgi:large subunit ribosomal protein L22